MTQQKTVFQGFHCSQWICGTILPTPSINPLHWRSNKSSAYTAFTVKTAFYKFILWFPHARFTRMQWKPVQMWLVSTTWSTNKVLMESRKLPVAIMLFLTTDSPFSYVCKCLYGLLFQCLELTELKLSRELLATTVSEPIFHVPNNA